jgi:glycosyltransferase involved in cell wall biosynthesis
MIVYHFVSSIDASTGGPARSITSGIQGLLDYSDSEVKLITGHSKSPEYGILKNPQNNVQFYQPNKYGWFKDLKFTKNINSHVLCHGHGLWELPIHQMAIRARNTNIPYIISPHGMIEPWALSQGRLKKILALKLYQRRDLEKAVCLHATSEMEAISIRRLGLRNPIAIIPNSIENTTSINSLNKLKNKKVLFLSRIHPKKGIENLIAAWKNIPSFVRFDWTLEIIGNGESDYINQLKSIVIKDGLSESVKILDPVFNDKKKEVYQSADIFVLPTFSENFGMVVAEAMSFGIPVITTKGAPWEELETRNAGWWIDIGVEPLTQALIHAISTPKEQLIEMGLNGRKLIEEKYTIQKVSKRMNQLYQWAAGLQVQRPDFIYII